MSVIASKRGETKLKVIDCAEKLANYTINIVSNEKHFPKRYRWIFASKIGDSVMRWGNATKEINHLIKVYKKEKINHENERPNH